MVKCLHGIYTVIMLAVFILGYTVAAVGNSPTWQCRAEGFLSCSSRLRDRAFCVSA